MKLTKRLAIGLMMFCALFCMLMLSVMKLQTANAAETPEKVVLKGDINGDGEVNMKDVILASQYLAGTVTLSEAQIEIGDVVKKDSQITLDDLIQICQRITGKDVEFDSCEHKNYTTVVTEPTCTEGGITTYICNSCAYTWTENPTDPTGHTPADAVEENRKEATCTATGSYDSVVYCAACDTELSRAAQTIPSKGHTPAEAVEENRVEATCAKAGSYDMVVKCSVCETELSRETKTIAKTTEHTEVINEAVAPTCTNTGLTEGKYCSECGAVLEEQTVVGKIGHTEEIIPAEKENCTKSGWTAGKKCSVCQAILEAQVLIPATGHTAGAEQRENEVSATCTQEGSYDATVRCTTCNTILSQGTVTVPMVEHNYQGNVEVPADTEFCKDILKTCTMCSDTCYGLSGNDNRTRHILSSEIVSATENECSDVKFTCQTCVHWYYQRSNNQDKTTHAWPTTGKTLTAATCVTDGVELYVCENCSSTKNGTLTATGHSYNEGVVVSATDAYCADTRYDCNDCDYFYYARRGENSANATELTAHNLTSTTKAATCTTDGETTYTCGNANCGYTKTETITKTGHNYKVEAVSASENECADEKYICQTAGCGDWYYSRSKNQNRTTHDWQLTATSDSTCYSAGLKVYTCSHCKATKEETIAQKTHNWQVTATNEATCYSAGMKISTCSLCKATKNEPITQLSHVYKSTTVVASATYCKDTKWTCSLCGKMYYERRGENSTNATELTAHSLTSTTKAATCTKDGSTTYTCTNANCGYTKTETISKLGHDYKVETIAGTADTCADTKYTCSRGDSTYYVGYGESHATELTGHSWGTATVVNAATCYSKGMKVSTCSHCNATKNEEIDQLKHQYKKIADVSATENYCKDTQYECTHCKDVYYTGYVSGKTSTALTLHVWNDGVVTKAVTCTTNGTKTYTCTHSGCGGTKTESIVAQGHNYADGKCTKCGEKLPGVIAFDPAEWGELKYTLKDDDTYEVAGIGTWKLPNIISISETYSGKAVTSIAASAFSSNKDIRKVEISNSVTSIGNSAFSGCEGLKSLTLGNGVTSIGNSAFNGCKGLTGTLTIPNGVTSIPERAFASCTGLTSVTIPNSVTSIGEMAFAYCTGLTGNLTIPESVTSITENAFRESSMTSVTIPGSVKEIKTYTFASCPALTNVIIGNGVTTISISAFSGSKAITNVTIPVSMKTIDSCAFGFAEKLNMVFYGGTSSQWSAMSISTSATNWYGDNSYFLSATRYYYSETQPFGTGNYWHFVNDIPTVWVCASANLTYTLSSDGTYYTVTGIGTCTDTAIVIPEFYNGKRVAAIDQYAFYNCSSMNSILIPDSVTSIGQNAFGGCGNLTIVYYGGTQTQWNTITGKGNVPSSATVCYYSEPQPTDTMNQYWHDVVGVPTKWE